MTTTEFRGSGSYRLPWFPVGEPRNRKQQSNNVSAQRSATLLIFLAASRIPRVLGKTFGTCCGFVSRPSNNAVIVGASTSADLINGFWDTSLCSFLRRRVYVPTSTSSVCEQINKNHQLFHLFFFYHSLTVS